MRVHRLPAYTIVAAVLVVAALSLSGCCEEHESDYYAPGGPGQPAVQTPAKSGFEARYIKQMMFQGSDLPVRPGIVSNTVIGTDKWGGAQGAGTVHFTVPNGKQTRKGKESFEFNGKYDPKTGKLTGTFRVLITYTTSGGGMPQVVDAIYDAKGTLTAQADENRQLAGTATGISAFQETYSGGNTDPPPLNKKASIDWTVTAILE
jgi:hypothetical protein